MKPNPSFRYYPRKKTSTLDLLSALLFLIVIFTLLQIFL